MIAVLLVDDQDLVRLGLRALLESNDGFAVAGEATDGLTAVEVAARIRPDVVLMDIRMPGIDGLEAARRIVTNPDLADTRVIMLTTVEREEYVIDALRLGVSGFLLKDTPATLLLEAIRTAADGGASLSPSVTRTLIREFVGQAHRVVTPHPQLGQLTDREREVVVLVAQGMNNDEIAQQLWVTRATVRTHASRAMIKLGARDRAMLVAFAYQSGLA